MGTHGLFGFCWKGKYYMMYNHWDSYPSRLGRQLVHEIVKANLRSWFKLFRRLRFVKESDDVSEMDISALSEWTDLSVSTQSRSDWYCLTRKCQGSLDAVLKSGYMLVDEYKDPSEWNTEWAYVVDFDQCEFRWFNGNSQQCWQFRLDKIPPTLFDGWYESQDPTPVFDDSILDSVEIREDSVEIRED